MPPKRSASSASTSQSVDPHATKKTRFVEPLDDPVNFAEQVDAELEDPSRKKGRVIKEGYESDSSDDGEGVVFSRRKDEQAGDGDDDMFAMAEDAATKEEPVSGKKKEEKTLRLGEIEGQEFGAEASGSESEEDEPEDEDDAARRSKAGMGYELSKFNMVEEFEEGKFTEDGSYVRTFDQHQVHDRWLDGVDEKDIKLARRRKRQQDKIQHQKMLAEERELEQSGGKDALELALLPYLKKGESVLEALQRIGKKTGPQKSTKRNGKADKGPQKPSDIENITHIASNIMSLGDTDIYSKTYEELVRSVRASGRVDSSWEPPSADVRYEYMWDVEGTTASGEIFGPYSEQEMQSWYKASYFGPSGEKIKIRAMGSDWSKWDELFS